jgi:UDP-N-acetylmuramoylalanine--D-glutamate ligase
MAAEPAPPAGARALVLGLGRFGGGLGVSRWLLDQGAELTVTDRLPRDALAASAGELEDSGATLRLEGHDGVDLAQFDLLVVNPAVPQSAPLVVAARERGLTVTSEMALLLERWPGPVLGVTGSNGKSTTVSQAQALLVAAGRDALAGGNLGGSLLPRLGEVDAQTVAVLELSSFMLEVTGPLGLGPDVAVVTNITPNHLDRHGTLEAYRDAKAAILARAHTAVLPSGDPLASNLPLPAGCRRLVFGSAGAGVDLGVGPSGALVPGDGGPNLPLTGLAAPGHAVRLDLAAAVLAVGALLDDHPGARAAVPGALRRWSPPRHRLEPVATRGDVTWMDDSASTTPESTAASVAAVDGPCLLIVGGRDKGLSPAALLDAAERCRLVFTVGEESAALARALLARGVDVQEAITLDAAVASAAGRARAGDTVLLSPGYSSHDQYAHFEARASAFAALVRALPDPGAGALSPPAAEC